MEKRGILSVLSLLFINFVHAQFLGFDYGSFSISNFFNTIDPSTVIYGLLFLILFTVIFLALSRMGLFKSRRRNEFGMPISEPNTIAAAVVSFCISALIVYYLYISGYNVQDFFYSLGFSGSLGSIFVVVLLVIIGVFMIVKFKFPAFFMIAGLLIMAISIFTDLVYEKGLAFLIGFAALIIGIFMAKKVRDRVKKMNAI